MMQILKSLCKLSNLFTLVMDGASHLAALGIRIYLAQVFLWSGWLKYTSWASTVYMFEHEFKVPIISPVLAAYIGTASELIFPILMLIGFGARIPAAIFFIVNIVMVYSYPLLFTEEFSAAFKDHIIWGILIAIIALYGHGKISLDYLLQRKVCKEYQY